MNTAMGWSVLLIMMIYALRSCKAQDSTSSARCRVPPYTVVGQQVEIRFLLSSDPKIVKKNVHIWKVTDGARICEPRNTEEGILDVFFNVTTEDMDNRYTREGYIYGGIDEQHFLSISIKKIGPQHEGIYVVEDMKGPFVCYLKVLAAPPSTQAPDTSTDGVKDSCAADERFFTMHKEDRNAWIQVNQEHIAVIIVTVIASALSVTSVSFGGYLCFRTVSAAFKTKTGEEETSLLHSGEQNRTALNTPGMPFRDFNVRRCENKKYSSPGSGRTRTSDRTGSTEGRAGSFASGVQPDPGNDDPVIDMGNHGTARSSVHSGETRCQGVAPRTRQTFN